jgi:hypothetical protein
VPKKRNKTLHAPGMSNHCQIFMALENYPTGLAFRLAGSVACWRSSSLHRSASSPMDVFMKGRIPHLSESCPIGLHCIAPCVGSHVVQDGLCSRISSLGLDYRTSAACLMFGTEDWMYWGL